MESAATAVSSLHTLYVYVCKSAVPCTVHIIIICTKYGTVVTERCKIIPCCEE